MANKSGGNGSADLTDFSEPVSAVYFLIVVWVVLVILSLVTNTAIIRRIRVQAPSAALTLATNLHVVYMLYSILLFMASASKTLYLPPILTLSSHHAAQLSTVLLPATLILLAVEKHSFCCRALYYNSQYWQKVVRIGLAVAWVFAVVKCCLCAVLSSRMWEHEWIVSCVLCLVTIVTSIICHGRICHLSRRLIEEEIHQLREQALWRETMCKNVWHSDVPFLPTATPRSMGAASPILASTDHIEFRLSKSLENRGGKTRQLSVVSLRTDSQGDPYLGDLRKISPERKEAWICILPTAPSQDHTALTSDQQRNYISHPGTSITKVTDTEKNKVKTLRKKMKRDTKSSAHHFEVDDVSADFSYNSASSISLSRSKHFRSHEDQPWALNRRKSLLVHGVTHPISPVPSVCDVSPISLKSCPPPSRHFDFPNAANTNEDVLSLKQLPAKCDSGHKEPVRFSQQSEVSISCIKFSAHERPNIWDNFRIRGSKDMSLKIPINSGCFDTKEMQNAGNSCYARNAAQTRRSSQIGLGISAGSVSLFEAFTQRHRMENISLSQTLRSEIKTTRSNSIESGPFPTGSLNTSMNSHLPIDIQDILNETHGELFFLPVIDIELLEKETITKKRKVFFRTLIVCLLVLWQSLCVVWLDYIKHESTSDLPILVTVILAFSILHPFYISYSHPSIRTDVKSVCCKIVMRLKGAISRNTQQDSNVWMFSIIICSANIPICMK